MLKNIIFNSKISSKLIRNFCVATETHDNIYSRSKAWQVHSYGEELQFCSIRNPIIWNPSEVLVKVEAASINPIDILMKDGYGRVFVKLFNFNKDMVLPLTLGRDFSGEIVGKGYNVKDFQIGDKVYGVIPFHKHGSHAELTIADQSHIIRRPKSLSHIEAASIPYAALTAYSALWITGGLCLKRHKGMKILILGASGGVGTMAVQMLKAVGVTVVATCATDAVPLVQSIGADCTLDYKSADYVQNVASQGSYDIILDCAQMGHKAIPPSWNYSSYISLNSPLLKNTDEYGLVAGLACSAMDIIPSNLMIFSQGKCIKWAFFYPSHDGLKFTDNLLRNNQLRPLIQSVFKFHDLPKAYEATKAGHLRGKIVMDMLQADEK